MTLPKKEAPPERRSWFEVVRTDAGWHCRLVGLNGEPVMASEVHPDRRDAERVLGLCRGAVARGGYVDARSHGTRAEADQQGPADDQDAEGNAG